MLARLLHRAVLPRAEEAAARRCRRRRSRSCRRYRWPGNVRELQNCIERAVILAEGDTIQPRHLNLSFAAPRRDGAAGESRGRRSICPARWPRRRGAWSPKSSGARSSRRCKEAGRQQGPRRRAARRSASRRCSPKLQRTPDSTLGRQRLHVPIGLAQRLPAISVRVTSSTIVGRADRRRQHEVQPSRDDLLVVPHRLERPARPRGRRSAAAARAGDQRRAAPSRSASASAPRATASSAATSMP